MCVPYSFVVTKEGDIVAYDNVQHHTEICERAGLDYDSVLKPEYQIWDKKLKDIEASNYGLNVDPVFFKLGDNTLSEEHGFLKNKFATRIADHISSLFPNWKRSLDWIEKNWEIVAPRAEKLSKNHPVSLIDTIVKEHVFFTDTLENRLKWLDKNFDKKAKVIDDSDTLGYNFKCVFNFDEFTKPKTLFQVANSQTLRQDVMMHAVDAQNFVKTVVWNLSYSVKKQVTNAFTKGFMEISKHIPASEVWTFEKFAKHWSKEENRVECWKS